MDSAAAADLVSAVPLRRPDLLVVFGAMSVVPVAILAFALSSAVRGTLHAQAESGAEHTAAAVASVVVPAYVARRDLEAGLSPGEARAVADAVGNRIVSETLLGIELRNSEGVLVYADEMPPGARTSSTDFTTALGGEVVADDVDMGGATTLRVSVPIEYPGSVLPAGVATLYIPHEAVHARMAGSVRKLQVILFVGLLLFYAVLFPIVASAARRLRRQAQENAHLARSDALTDLPNRIVFREEMESALRRLDDGGAAVVVMVVDIDSFKTVNDRFGHACGDRMLQIVGARLRHSMRAVDVVARIGGDEFGVLMPRANASFSQQIASRLRDAVAEPIVLDGTRIVPSASIGIAFAPEHGGDFESLLHEADLAMYAAKQRGGGRFRIADPRRAAPAPVEADTALETSPALAAGTPAP